MGDSALIELHFEPEALDPYGLPDIGYPISLELFDEVMGRDGHLPFAELLYFLQVQSASNENDWRASEGARSRLAELLAPADPRTTITAAGPEWCLEVGPVDLARPVITIHREDTLIAAVQSRENGSLRVAGYRPLDSRSARLLIDLALRPHPHDGTVCTRANNWEYALDCSASMGQFYAAQRGEAHLWLWENGLGVQGDGQAIHEWQKMRQLVSRPPAQVTAELGVAYVFGEG